jgi:hypothetical protein
MQANRPACLKYLLICDLIAKNKPPGLKPLHKPEDFCPTPACRLTHLQIILCVPDYHPNTARLSYFQFLQKTVLIPQNITTQTFTKLVRHDEYNFKLAYIAVH